MKVGDLVELSAYGRRRKRAEWIAAGDVGLIVKLIEYSSPHYPTEYKVRWMKSTYTTRYSYIYLRQNTRADLKYVKLKTTKGEQ